MESRILNGTYTENTDMIMFGSQKYNWFVLVKNSTYFETKQMIPIKINGFDALWT